MESMMKKLAAIKADIAELEKMLKKYDCSQKRGEQTAQGMPEHETGTCFCIDPGDPDPMCYGCSHYYDGSCQSCNR